MVWWRTFTHCPLRNYFRAYQAEDWDRLKPVGSGRNLLSTPKSQICGISPWKNPARWMFLKNGMSSLGISGPQGLAISFSCSDNGQGAFYSWLTLTPLVTSVFQRTPHMPERGTGCSSRFTCSFCPLPSKFTGIYMCACVYTPGFLPVDNLIDLLVALMKF